MAVKKEETVEKKPVKKTATKKTTTSQKKTSANKSTSKPKTASASKSKNTSTAPKPKKQVKSIKQPKTVNDANSNIEDRLDLSSDFNKLLSFDVYVFRELFMEIRKLVDELYSKRERSEKDLAAYDEAVYNITANTVHESAAQDFMSFCYKKGFYDFCILNYEKYMKWSILAAANGNAFTLSKLQIFLTTAVDKLYQIENLDVLFDFLDLTEENFVLFLSKMICIEMVSILDLSPENLIKMPEKYVEQNEELTKMFDRVKMQASVQAEDKIKKAINQLLENLKIYESQNNKLEPDATEEVKVDEKETEQQQIKKAAETKTTRFDRKPSIKKKFRY